MQTPSFRVADLLRALLVLVPLAAAIETVLLRVRTPWRAHGFILYLQAGLLWLALGLLACVPAALTMRVLGRAAPKRVETLAAVLAGWMVGPVVLHHVLDRYTGARGNALPLASGRPWGEAALALMVLVLSLLCLARLLGRWRPGQVALVVGLLSLAAGSLLPWRGRSAAAGGTRSAADAPNLLLLVWDTTRSDRLQPYGFERATTPGLQRFAEEAWTFEDSVSTACFTFSSHVSLLTGVYPSVHGARFVKMRYDPRRAASLAATLRSNGYRTGGFVGTDVLTGKSGLRYGFDLYEDQVDPPVCDSYGWRVVHDLQAVLARHFEGLRNNGQPHWFEDFQRPAEEVLARALQWIERDDPRPWFCFVNLYDAHWPYVPCDSAARELVTPYEGALDGYLFRSDRWRAGTTIGDADQRHVSELYEAELLELDRRVDAFLAALELEAGGTAVLITSDHGEAFGEAGRWKHEDISEPQVRVPLMLRLPEVRPTGKRVRGPVSGVDVAPTLLALAGVEAPEGIDGIDLVAESPQPDRVILVEDRDHLDVGDVRVALYRSPFKLVRRGLGEDITYRLHDLRYDSLDQVDVQDEHPEVFRELVQLLTERRLAFDASEAEAAVQLGDQTDALRALGYMGGQ